MKKILLLMSLGIYAFAYKFSPEEFQTLQNPKNTEQLATYFFRSTAETDYMKIYEEALKDDDFLKGMFFMQKKVESKEDSKYGETVFSVPMYERALKHFAKSENLLSSFAGIRVLEKFLLFPSEENRMLDYLDDMADPLLKKNYCIGYLYKIKSLQLKKSKEVYDLIEQSKSCQKEGIYKYIVDGLSHEAVRAKTIKKVREAKENGSLKQMGVK